MVAALFTIVLAQWSTNTAANLMPATYIVLSICPKLNYAKATILSAVIGIAMCPWVFADKLIPFQVACSVLLGPIIGIMLGDYYIIRKMELNVAELYDEKNQVAYKKPAMMTLFISAAVGLAIAVGIANKGVGYSFYASFITSVLLYPVLVKKA